MYVKLKEKNNKYTNCAVFIILHSFLHLKLKGKSYIIIAGGNWKSTQK